MIDYCLELFGFLAHLEITARTPENEVISNFGFKDQYPKFPQNRFLWKAFERIRLDAIFLRRSDKQAGDSFF